MSFTLWKFNFSFRESGFRSDVLHRLYASNLASSSSSFSNGWIEGNKQCIGKLSCVSKTSGEATGELILALCKCKISIKTGQS